MKAPDKTGVGGREAWKVRSDRETTLNAWIVRCPGLHAFWDKWLISVVHLRHVPGTPPAEKQYPEAEYEFMILSCDPKHDPDVETPEIRFLMPPDAIVQFHGMTDEQVTKLCDLAIDAILRGEAHPDSDFRSEWKSMIKATVEHFTTGHGGVWN